MVYDLIIIGAGPAGITAGIYAARRKVNFLMISKDLGGQMIWSSDVENYPGFHLLSGAELTNKFNEHLKDYKINIKYEKVVDLEKRKDRIVVRTKESVYESLSVIIASGKRPLKLNVSGEDKLIGRGVSYCATCDAPFFKGKTVAVIGGKNSAFDACLNLSNYAKKIYLIDIEEKLGGEPFLRDKVLKDKKVSYISDSRVIEIIGDKDVTALKYVKDGVEKKIRVGGIFIEIGLIPNTEYAKIIEKNSHGEIMIKRSTKTNEENMTNVGGIFAAGDVTDIPSKQIIIAAGEGCKAALASFEYIEKLR